MTMSSAATTRLPRLRALGIAEHLLRDDRFHPRAAARGTVLTDEGAAADHAVLLLDGWIGLSKVLPSGDAQIIDVMLPGDFALIGTEVVPVAACRVEALSDVAFLAIPPAAANGSDAASARLRQLMAAALLTTQSRTAELLLRLGRGDAANRVAYALLEFYVRLEAVGRVRGRSFAFPITQQKLGEFTGLTNVHVSRTMRRLERAGLVRHRPPGTITLSDLGGLCDVAEIELEPFREEILMRAPA
jgi:CRP-like cAMP-binding protein